MQVAYGAAIRALNLNDEDTHLLQLYDEMQVRQSPISLFPFAESDGARTDGYLSTHFSSDQLFSSSLTPSPCRRRASPS